MNCGDILVVAVAGPFVTAFAADDDVAGLRASWAEGVTAFGAVLAYLGA